MSFAEGQAPETTFRFARHQIDQLGELAAFVLRMEVMAPIPGREDGAAAAIDYLRQTMAFDEPSLSLGCADLSLGTSALIFGDRSQTQKTELRPVKSDAASRSKTSARGGPAPTRLLPCARTGSVLQRFCWSGRPAVDVRGGGDCSGRLFPRWVGPFRDLDDDARAELASVAVFDHQAEHMSAYRQLAR